MTTTAKSLGDNFSNPVLSMNGKKVKTKTKAEELNEALENVRRLEMEKMEEDLAQQERKAAVKKQRIANSFFTLLKEEGFDLESVHEAKSFRTSEIEEDKQPVLSTSNGVIVKLFLFVSLIMFFIMYQTFFGETMNDSSKRIFDAMEAHMWTHFALALGTILFGFGIMYLMFPCQFRYFHNKIHTEHSWSKDFDSPTFEGVVRMVTTFLAWSVPTFICANVMQLILG